jgi:hypothetical protein
MRRYDIGRGLGRHFGLVLVLLTACVSSREPSALGGESHFLRRCEDQCGMGLDCIQGVCTRGCVVGKASCSDLALNAVCTASSIEPGEVAVCDLACSQDVDCAALSPQHRCEAGFCRAPAPEPAPDPRGPISTDAGGATGAASGNLASTDAGGTGAASPDKIVECPEDVSSDPVDVQRSRVLGDTLVLDVRYGGGCNEHTFSLCYEPTFQESDPVQSTLRLIHDAHGDTCEAYPAAELRFDLSPLAELYEHTYPRERGLIRTSYGFYAFGTLTCKDRAFAASQQIADYTGQVTRECETFADCVWAPTKTTCFASCDGAYASKAGGKELLEWLAVTSSAVCGDYEGDGCAPLVAPQCEPPIAADCIGGQCVAFE